MPSDLAWSRKKSNIYNIIRLRLRLGNRPNSLMRRAYKQILVMLVVAARSTFATFVGPKVYRLKIFLGEKTSHFIG